MLKTMQGGRVWSFFQDTEPKDTGLCSWRRQVSNFTMEQKLMHWQFFPHSTDSIKSSITCTAAPQSERGAAELLSEALLPTLWVSYLLISSESHSIHTLPSSPYAVATSSSLLPSQALSRFYQHPLNKSVSPWTS